MFLVNGNFITREDMNESDKKWLCPEEAKREARLNYINSFTKALPSICPECEGHLITDEDHIYCENCGLIAMASIQYVAGQKITLPYGTYL